MGARGPAKKPAAAHKRAGTYRKNRHQTHEVPKAAPVRPKMNAVASAAWDRIIPALERTGYLAEIDAEALRQLCEAIADYEAAGEQIKKFGVLVTHEMTSGARVKKLNPAWSMRNSARKAIVTLCAQFGMTPSGRTGLVAKDDGSLSPELAAILGLNLN